MENYLQRLAKLFFSEYGTDISRFTFVFPNRRAGLFFRTYIGKASPTPLIAPDFLTINQCFEMLSDMHLADQLSLLFKLYHIYISETKSDETFDKFVFWGEMLLSDFNDIDKHLVNAKLLFSNLTDLKKIDNHFDYMSEEQLKAIRQFWKNFEGFLIPTKESFLNTWNYLYAIYQKFNEELIHDKCGYEGLIHRQVIQRIDLPETETVLQDKQFVFIGFNALNPCEKALMKHLQKKGIADFYWDYEAAEVRDKNNRASDFMQNNLHDFPSKLSLPTVIENLQKKGENGKINLIGVPSAIGQASTVHDLLEKLHPNTNDTDYTQTAVVLSNENLLLPLLHTLPRKIEKVNVTMGYPLRNTPVFGLMEHIFGLQLQMRTDKNNKTVFYHKNVQNILNHPYIYNVLSETCKTVSEQIISLNLMYVPESMLHKAEILQIIFTPQHSGNDALNYLYNILEKLQDIQIDRPQTDQEYIYQYYVTINRVRDIFALPNAPDHVKPETIFKLMRELTRTISIPFVGEPLNGLQVMGTLETRGLDFKNLIITSMNEGVFPKKQNQNSFIPYHLRKGFGLPTYEQYDAIFAYNFYRLIHHAENIYFIYDTRTDGNQTGEVSRFIHQLKYQYHISINEQIISSQLLINKTKNIQIVKDEHVMNLLARYKQTTDEPKYLSASAINTYLDCPLKFYLSYVEGLAKTDEVQENIESDVFGTMLHAVMQNLYAPYKNRMLFADNIRDIRNNTVQIQKEIAQAYTKTFLKINTEEFHYPEGSHKIIADVIEKYVKQLLVKDEKHTPFTFVDAELNCHTPFELSNRQKVNLKGYIDRIDEKDNTIRIIDYKTGTGEPTFQMEDLSDLFDATKDKRPKYVLQTFFYALLYKAQRPTEKALEPNIFYARDLFKVDYDTQIHYKPDKKTNTIVTDYVEYEDKFTARLTEFLENLFSPEIPFTQSNDTKPCKFCPFNDICRR